MMKKCKLVTSVYLIKLVTICQEDLTLHYIYEHVPYSLPQYIHLHLTTGSPSILHMSRQLFLKKITYDIAMLINYLIEMNIEIDLSIHSLGLTADENLKVFMNHKCRMGHKTQLSLIAFYSSRKDTIISFLQQ